MLKTAIVGAYIIGFCVTLVHAEPSAMWTCALDCGVQTSATFVEPVSHSGFVALKNSIDRHRVLRRVSWPFGVRFNLDADRGSESGVGRSERRRCEAAGDTAALAMKSLESRVTGKNLPVMAIRCQGCSEKNLEQALCSELKSGTQVSYSVLKSRMNPEAQSSSSPSSAAASAVKAQ